MKNFVILFGFLTFCSDLVYFSRKCYFYRLIKKAIQSLKGKTTSNQTMHSILPMTGENVSETEN